MYYYVVFEDGSFCHDLPPEDIVVCISTLCISPLLNFSIYVVIHLPFFSYKFECGEGYGSVPLRSDFLLLTNASVLSHLDYRRISI